MKNNSFQKFSSPQKRNKNQFNRIEEQRLSIQTNEYTTIEKEVLKELDQISKKHCVQFFPNSSTTSKNQLGSTKTSFPMRNSNITLSPRQIRLNQEQDTIYQKQGTNRSIQKQNKQHTSESEIFDKTQLSLNRNNIKGSDNQKKSWISPIVQKQDQFLSQQKLLLQRQKKASFSGRYQNVFFQVESKCTSIYSLGDKKQCMDQIKKQSHSFYGESKNGNEEKNEKKKVNINQLQLSNICQLPSFNSSFRIHRLNSNSLSHSTKNIDKIRSFSNTSYSMIKEPWVKQEFFKTLINDPKKQMNSFDFYFYDENGGIHNKFENIHTDVSQYKKSIDSKR